VGFISRALRNPAIILRNCRQGAPCDWDGVIPVEHVAKLNIGQSRCLIRAVLDLLMFKKYAVSIQHGNTAPKLTM